MLCPDLRTLVRRILSRALPSLFTNISLRPVRLLMWPSRFPNESNLALASSWSGRRRDAGGPRIARRTIPHPDQPDSGAVRRSDRREPERLLRSACLASPLVSRWRTRCADRRQRGPDVLLGQAATARAQPRTGAATSVQDAHPVLNHQCLLLG